MAFVPETKHSHITPTGNIFQYALEGKSEEVKTLVEAEPKWLSKTDEDQRTILHWAVSGGHEDLLDYLIQKGMDVNLEDDSNWTPLMIATSTGNLKIVKKLLDCKADPKRNNTTKRSPLHYAASKNKIDV
ncbi:prosome, macropain 26S subunit, non-ATPase, 10, isoform CRA_c [Globomyces pollinis-pini]|nr:prosome, macropain 26S subunit, non-ATPase, 10, isoform CRA_c [Globomyces pollinis-pini]